MAPEHVPRAMFARAASFQTPAGDMAAVMLPEVYKDALYRCRLLADSDGDQTLKKTQLAF